MERSGGVYGALTGAEAGTPDSHQRSAVPKPVGTTKQIQVLYAAIAIAAVSVAAFVGVKDFGFFSGSSVGDVVNNDDGLTLGFSLNRSTGWWDGDNETSPTYRHSSDAANKLLQALQSMNDVNAIGFGHQYSNYQGQKWPWFQYWGEYDKSDVYNDTHDYPLVFGYDLQDYLKGHSYEDYIIWAGENGAIISFSWLADNPACVYYNQTDKASDACDAYNNTCFGMNILAEIIPGGTLNHIWTSWLDDLSALFDLLKFSNGDEIPFVLRLFHECTAKWYWWGTGCGTGSDMVRAWNYTQYYLQDVKGHTGILWEYAPSKPSQYTDEFEDYYPGDDHVDIVSFDRYAYNSTYDQYVTADCKAIVKFGEEHSKVVSLSETGILYGIQNVTDPDWFLDKFLEPITEYCPELAYAMTYTDFSKSEYWVPLKGEQTYKGFMEMYSDQHSVFLGDSYWQNTKYYTHVTGISASGVGSKEQAEQAAPSVSSSSEPGIGGLPPSPGTPGQH